MDTPWNSPENKARRPVAEDKPQSDKASSQGTPPNSPDEAEEDAIMTDAETEEDPPDEDLPEEDSSEEDSSEEDALDEDALDEDTLEVKPPVFAQFLYKTNRLRASVVAFSPDNRLIAIGHTVAGLISTKIELWELRDGAFTRTWQVSKPEDAVTALQFSPDG
jgi:hypothetical protein